jgi:hemolysin III
VSDPDPAPRPGGRAPGPRPYTRAEQLADAAIHVVGVVAALMSVPVLVALAAVLRGDGPLIAAVAVYGSTLVLMLALSAGYNIAAIGLQAGRALDWLRRLDHAAIYVKIAGTYTPFAVIAGGPVGRWLLIGVWSGALLGMLHKLIAPWGWERVAIVFYLALGWAFVFAAGPISEALTGATLALLLIAGVLYSVGVIFHVWERLPFQNAIWHLFVLVASFVCYAAVAVEIAIGA